MRVSAADPVQSVAMPGDLPPGLLRLCGHFDVSRRGRRFDGVYRTISRAAAMPSGQAIRLDLTDLMTKSRWRCGRRTAGVEQLIGPYRLVESLGQGAMGVVYRARHTDSEHAVALKTVRVPSPHWLESIRREIRALTRIQHPGVVRIIDHGVHQGRPWYAMDLLEGESLRHFGHRLWSPYRPQSLPRGLTEGVSATEDLGSDTAREALDPGAKSAVPPFDTGSVPAAAGELATVLRLVRRVCATLAFLHGEGFVNCDLKSEHVMLVNGDPIIIDFGLTAHHPVGTSREALEVQSIMSGTLPYMSPEQIRGEFVDARSDLYAVGCLLYELVAGKLPFSGAPRSILSQHLSQAPQRPSEIVEALPEGLEELLLKLLAKDRTERFGHADEVAAELARFSGDVRNLKDFPSARAYLYRPRLVGRRDVVQRLAALRDRAVGGAGSLVLIGGESGVGKTRVAMEVTRIVPSSQMQIVTSEGSALSVESGGFGAAPLHAVRPLLRAVADLCQEGGADLTDRLLGDARALLAPYEPLLEDVPAHTPLESPVSLPFEAARKRLFEGLASTLFAFARHRPVLWVIDDLGWVDDLSLEFLRSLSAAEIDLTPVLILCTYRTEESIDAVAALTSLLHVTHIKLGRLDRAAVQSMLADMLALKELPEGFADFVAHHAEGNPFFVGEYVRMAVADRLLHRDDHKWKLRSTQAPSFADREYQALLPHSLRDFLEKRLQRLSPFAKHVGLAAAVLGREVDAELVREVGALSEDALTSAVDELVRRQILEQTEPGRFRFVHDKLREVAYSGASGERRSELHARAAAAIEARLVDPAQARRSWAALGHHLSAAGSPEAAVSYLRLAADHARATYANGDALRLYREAVNQVNLLVGAPMTDAPLWRVLRSKLHEALAGVLALTSQREQAREVFQAGLADTPESDAVQRTRLHRKIGKTFQVQHEHEKALDCFRLARQTAGGDPIGDLGAEWFQVRIDELSVFYYLNRVSEMDALAAELEPIIDHRATPLQRAEFFRTQWLRNLRRDRYVCREETLGFARSALAASLESGDRGQIAGDEFGLGFVLLFCGRAREAAEALSSGLHGAELCGDLAKRARCLAYLSMATRMQGKIEETRDIAERTYAAAREASMVDYVAAALANQAWVALRNGALNDAYRIALEAVQTWQQLAFAFPLQWLALVPLLEVCLLQRNMPQAVSCVEALLAASQHDLGETVRGALVEVASTWQAGCEDIAASAIVRALEHLGNAGYR